MYTLKIIALLKNFKNLYLLQVIGLEISNVSIKAKNEAKPKAKANDLEFRTKAKAKDFSFMVKTNE